MQFTGHLGLTPKPSVRPRFTCRGKFAVAYKDRKYREWLDEAAAVLSSLGLPEGWDKAAPVRVHATFKVKKPKTSKLKHPKPDIDNYEKSFLDAITQAGNVWDDDCQVVEMLTSKCFVEDEWEEGIHFLIEPLETT